MIGVKICGVCRPRDARTAAEAGATHLGVIVGAPGPRRRTREQAAAIYEAGTGLLRVGVFADQPAESVIESAAFLRLDVVQLHGDEGADIVAHVAAAGPWAVWKAVRPLDAAGLSAHLDRWRCHIDGLLVDGSAPGALGGTGVRAPWDALAAARWSGATPRLVLAGGLRPENVAEAVQRLVPDVVDVSSGVEAAVGEKDGNMVRAFVGAARVARQAASAREASR